MCRQFGKPDVTSALRDAPFIGSTRSSTRSRSMADRPIRPEPGKNRRSSTVPRRFSGGRIHHDQPDRAFYNRRTDTASTFFKTAPAYYRTAFNELVTGLVTRIVSN